MKAMHNDLFPTIRAAEGARAREFGDALPGAVRAWVERDTRPWSLIHWQRSGQGHGSQMTICPTAEVEDAMEERRSKFGEFHDWEVEQFTPGQTATPCPAEDIRTSVHRDFTNARTSSQASQGWRPGLHAESAHRVERPPDG